MDSVNAATPGQEALPLSSSPSNKRKRDTEDGEDGLFVNDDDNDLLPDLDAEEDVPPLFTAPDENEMVPEDDGMSVSEDDFGSDLDSDAEESAEGDSDVEIEKIEVKSPVQTYDVAEQFPDCAAYDPKMAAIKEDLVSVPKKVIELLDRHDCDSKDFRTTLKSAKALLKIPSPKKPRIALLGDAGAGKSSVLNSLSDVHDLANSLSGGQSCTAVPTEYSGAFPRQKKDFAANIRYFDIKKIRQLLSEMRDDYNLYVFNFDKDWDIDTTSQYMRKMQNALKTFKVLFCDLSEFESLSAAKNFLEQDYKNNYDRNNSGKAIELMMDSCETKLKDKMCINDGAVFEEYFEARSRAKLRETIDPLMNYKMNADSPALWPLVERVCIGVRSTRLLDHVTIIDLPGISDTNEVRLNFTKEYVKSCDNIWIVAQISRVVDSIRVWHLITKYGHVFKGRVAIICTHSDDGADRKLKEYLRDAGQDISKHERLTQEVKEMKRELTKFGSRIKTLNGHKTQTKQKLLMTREMETNWKKMKGDYNALESQKLGSLVTARNVFVANQLQELFEDHIPTGKDLDVYCVSNVHYAALRGVVGLRGTRLTVEATGVPALRAFALAIPAPAFLRAVDDFKKHSMVVFLENATIWANITAIERREELFDFAKQPGRQLAEHVAQRVSGFKEEVQCILLGPMRSLQNEATAHALKMFEQKQKKHASTVRAFIRKDGNHSTKMCPQECWNEQFSKVMIDFIRSRWEQVEHCVRARNEKLKDELIADLRGIITNLNDQPSAAALDLDRMTDLVQGHVAGIENRFRDGMDVYETNLRNIILDIIQHSDRNYFSRNIQPVYEECKLDSGHGVTKRSMNRIEEHLSAAGAKSPFVKMERSTSTALLKDDWKHMEMKISNPVSRIFKEVQDSFDRLIDGAVEDPTETPVREDLKSNLAAFKSEFHRVCRQLEQIKAAHPV